MSTSPDRIVSLLSNWLGGRLQTDELRRQIDEIGTTGLAPGLRRRCGSCSRSSRRQRTASAGSWRWSPRDARSRRTRLAFPVFTGIVRERGRVVRAEGGPDGLALELEAPETAAASAVGDSVSIAGACLTVTSVGDGRMTFHAVPETLERSSLGRLEPGVEVNLEPALRAGDPLGGHYVQGHVDGLGRRSLARAGGRRRPPLGGGARRAAPLLRRQGLDHRRRRLSHHRRARAGRVRGRARPAHARGRRRSARLRPGDPLNLEVDVLAKYVEKLVQADGTATIRRG